MNNDTNYPIKVLAVDPYPVVTQGIVSFLLADKQLFTVNAACNAKDSLRTVKQWKPDNALLDINLPDISEFPLMKQFEQENIKVIIFADLKNNEHIIDYILSGARGYLLKDCSKTEMIEALLKIYNNEVYFPRNIKSPIRSATILSTDMQQREFSISNLCNIMTHREKDILLLISHGLQNKEIAIKLGIKNRTVEYHVSNILSKLGVTSRVEAVIACLKINLGDCPRNF